jgi:hypothetical protein
LNRTYAVEGKWNADTCTCGTSTGVTLMGADYAVFNRKSAQISGYLRHLRSILNQMCNSYMNLGVGRKYVTQRLVPTSSNVGMYIWTSNADLGYDVKYRSQVEIA